jgi:hypothetical protein
MLDHISLFDNMDAAADLMRHTNCAYSEADDQWIFRKLQKEKLPGLSDEQFQTLFAEWQEHYHGKCEQDWIRALGEIARYSKEQAKRNPPAAPFRCVCGAETKDPLAPDFWAIPKPHFEAKARGDSCHQGASDGRF